MNNKLPKGVLVPKTLMEKMYTKERTATPIEKTIEVSQSGRSNTIKVDGKTIIVPTQALIDTLVKDIGQLRHDNEELKNQLRTLSAQVAKLNR